MPMKNKHFSFYDFLILFGLGLLGAGLYFWAGLGPALTADGAIILTFGVLLTK